MKMRAMACTLFCSAILSTPLLAQSESATGDQAFADMAAQTDMMEAHLGQMMSTEGTTSDVKDYAQMLVTDHTNDYNLLTAAAQKANLMVPKGLNAAHDAKMAPLEKMKGGKALDLRYAHEMVTGHEQAIAAYKKEAENAQSADIKAYAQQAIPVLQKHLDGAEKLLKEGK